MRKFNDLPENDYLNECFNVDPDGFLTWKPRPLSHFKDKRSMNSFNSRYLNRKVEKENWNGYILVCINFKLFRVHRLIYQMNAGKIPDGFDVDHINGNRKDNRFENLRIALRSENLHNSKVHKDSKTGVKGVTLNPCGTYLAKTMVRGKNHHRTFSTIAECSDWLNLVRKEIHGKFANNGTHQGESK